MKLITAIIQPGAEEELKTALSEGGITGLTISQVRGFGVQKGYTEVYRGAKYDAKVLLKSKFEIVCNDDFVTKITDLIIQTVQTGNPGDGKIWVTNVEEVIRISNGVKGKDAVSVVN
jgi:nitrogen regulatory protein PII